MELVYKDEVFKIIGAAMEVHNELKNGYLEDVYQEALEHEFKIQGIPFETQKMLPITYKGMPLKQFYKADFLCYDKIIVEIKAVSCLNDNHKAQVLNYLKCTGCKVGLLINFGEQSLKTHRLIL